MIRVCLDVNVWVNNYLALLRTPDRRTPARGLIEAVHAGFCRLGGLQLIVSHDMLDTLEDVLGRYPVTAPVARLAREQVEGAAAHGCIGTAPSIILGGTASFPMRDDEDASVLAAAITGQADLLVTENMRHFVRGPNARLTTDPEADPGPVPDMTILTHPRLQGRLTIAKSALASAWLLDGVQPPRELLRPLTAPAEDEVEPSSTAGPP